ncbi:MAG: EamA family transporter [Chitinophagales bacterium]
MNTHQPLKIGLAFASVYIIWGSTYLAILFGLKSLPPFLMASLRFLLAGLLLFIWRIIKGDRLPSRLSIQQNGLCGILTLFGGVGSVGWAEQYLPSGVAAIIVTAVPFWFVLFDRKQWAFYFSNKLIIGGLIFGFAGVALLVGLTRPAVGQAADSRHQLLAALMIMAGGIAWTTGSLYSKYQIKGNSILMNGSVQFLMAGVFSALVSFLFGEWKNFSPQEIILQSWLALFYLITMGSLVAYLAYLWLLKKRPAAQVSTYVYVNPVIAVLLGAILANEKISWLQIAALAVILCGVLMVNLPKYKKQAATQ